MRVSRLPALLALSLAMPVGGCDLPVYWGVKDAQSAGLSVGGMPVSPFARLPAATESASAGPSPDSSGNAAARIPAAPSRAAFTGRVVMIPAVPQPVRADDIVGLKLEQAERGPARPVTFGQVFIPGQLAAGQSVVAMSDGQALPTQLDVKTTNPDGSARMGVVTVQASAPAALMLTRIPAAAGPAVDLAQAAARLGLTVDLAFHDAAGSPGAAGTRHFDIGALLARALQTGSVSFWLRGPLATEGRIEVPVVDSMRLTMDIRAYADGSTMADIQFNNDIAMQPKGGKLTYDVTISRDGKPVLRETGLEHYQYQTWHHQAWSDGDPGVNVVHDVAALARAGAVHNYDLSIGVAGVLLDRQLQSMRDPGFRILGNAGITKGMGMTGGRPDIGPVTLANTLWLMTQHPDAARFALAQADAAGSIPWHLFDIEAKTYITATKYPKLWNDYRGGRWDTQALTQPGVAGHGWEPDTAHQPDLSYVAYILTGLRYRLDQVQAQASGSIIGIWTAARQDDRAIVTSMMDQVRGRAWALRVVNEASYVCPDKAAICPYFAGSLRNSVDNLLIEVRSRTRGATWGWFGNVGVTVEGGAISPWMEDFLANTMVLLTQQGVPGAREVVRYQSHFLAGRFLAESQGFHPFNGTSYRLNMYARVHTEPYETWREVQADSLARGFAKDGSVWANNDWAYVQAAQGVLGGIVSATSSPEAERAMAWMHEHAPHAGKADLQGSPSFNIVPLPPADRR